MICRLCTHWSWSSDTNSKWFQYLLFDDIDVSKGHSKSLFFSFSCEYLIDVLTASYGPFCTFCSSQRLGPDFLSSLNADTVAIGSFEPMAVLHFFSSTAALRLRLINLLIKFLDVFKCSKLTSNPSPVMCVSMGFEMCASSVYPIVSLCSTSSLTYLTTPFTIGLMQLWALWNNVFWLSSSTTSTVAYNCDLTISLAAILTSLAIKASSFVRMLPMWCFLESIYAL